MRFTRTACRLLTAFALVATIASTAAASHFRFSHMTWRRVSGSTVDITLTAAWRGDAYEGITVFLSDGSSICFNIPGAPFGCVAGGPGAGDMADLGTFTDIGGEQYRIGSGTARHTFPSESIFTATAGSCCRIYSLINASGASWSYAMDIDLTGGNLGSPVSSLPVILQVPIDTIWSFNLPIGDPDGDTITCRSATSAESGIPSTPSIGGNLLSVNAACQLNWDTNGGVAGSKYAFQVVIEEVKVTHSNRVPLDFILELVSGGQPDCSGGGSFLLSPGVPFSTTLTGTDPDGDNLKLLVEGATPPGSSFTPPPGTTQGQPFAVQFDWTPTLADLNTSYAFTVVFEDPVGLRGQCGMSVTVVDNPTFNKPTCGQVFEASEGSPVAIDIEAVANTGLPGESVTIELVGTIPPGSFFDPALPVSGQPATTTFKWPNPTTGNYTVTLKATDQLQQETICSFDLNVNECFLLGGVGTGSWLFPPDTTLVVDPLVIYPVTMENIPELNIPNNPNLLGIHFYSQVVMRNPNFDPIDPIKASNGLDTVIGGTTSNFGFVGDGINLSMIGSSALGGKLIWSFTIDGM